MWREVLSLIFQCALGSLIGNLLGEVIVRQIERVRIRRKLEKEIWDEFAAEEHFVAKYGKRPKEASVLVDDPTIPDRRPGAGFKL